MTQVRFHKDDGVSRITINRPERRNALTSEITRGIAEALKEVQQDRDCRCLVITGEGEHFAAGRDLTEIDDRIPPVEEITAKDDAWVDVFKTLRNLDIPSLAVVRGFAVAGGFTLAMGCDFVLAEKGAKFGALEMKGGFPACVNTSVLTHLLGPRQALELLLSDDVFDAEHLYRVGLINRLAEDAEDLARQEKIMITGFLRLDQTAVKWTKDIHRIALGCSIDEALTVGSQMNSLMMASGRFARAAQRFAKRRK